ncbi:MAG: HAMP domain-containing sensor histidine kinase [Solirubrobacterales bacterium]
MRSGFRLPDLSLRVRLVLLLLALATVGLATLDFVSYRALHGYLFDRVDQQVEAAVKPLSFALADELTASQREQVFGTTGTEGATPPQLIPRSGSQPPSRGGGPGSAADLPPGTYGELRDAEGNFLKAGRLFEYEGEEGPVPALPDNLTVSSYGDSPHLFTVGAEDGDSERFRAVAEETPGGATVIVAVPLGDTEETLERLALIELVVSGAILISLGLAAWWLVGVGLRPLRRMGEVAGDIAAGDLSRRVESTNPRTEVGRLGIALNKMLSQIEQAFAEREAGERRLRRFLADASHELRTPLAAIRGYSELHRLGASSEPAEVDRAMARIEAESARMGGLVDDLLTLARIDEVRVPEAERVELGELLIDACDDARAASPDRQIGLGEGVAVAVEGDHDQLRRVFDNLLRNAVVHTPPGTAIEVSLERDGEEAVASVRDHGDGLPDGEPEALFDRFWRSSASRSRDDGGAGLGLAIVAAVVEAHGGRVEAADAPGGGAVFTVRLPAAG